MAEESKIPEGMDSAYGRVSIMKELGKGVSMIITTASLSAVVVSKSIADRFMSPSGISRGDKLDDALGYPDDSLGRIHIPLYELATKNQIKLLRNQIKDHFNNLIRLIPEYLRERGLIAPKPVYTLADKINDEYDDWYAHLKKTSTKDELIRLASEIDRINKLKNYYLRADFPLDKQGVLISVPDLLETTYDYMVHNKMEFTEESFSEITNIWKTDIEQIIPKDMISICNEEKEKIISEFKRELAVARPDYIKMVNLRLTRANGDSVDLSVTKEDFEDLLLTDSLRAEFAKNVMLDYPAPDYYGEEYADLFNALFLKRFESNIYENWDNYSFQSNNGVTLEIKSMSTDIAVNNAYDELINRCYIKEYLEANCPDPDYKKLVAFAEKNAETINSVNNMIEQLRSEVKTEAVTEKITDFEAYEVRKEDVQRILSEQPKYSEPRYIVNSEEPQQYIKLESADNDEVIITACIGTTVANQLSPNTMEDCLTSFTSPCMLSQKAFDKLNGIQVTEGTATVSQTFEEPEITDIDLSENDAEISTVIPEIMEIEMG